MSFSQDVKNELLDVSFKKKCCRKAYLLGLLFNASLSSDGNVCVDYPSEIIADSVLEMISSCWSTKARKEQVQKPGKIYYRLTFRSKIFQELIFSLDNDPDTTITENIGFICASCEQSFSRGVFISCAKINDPQNSYLLEFSLSKQNLPRASKLYRFLSVSGFVPKIVNRSTTSGLYFKNNTTISDILYFCGAVRASFDYANEGIKKEIRNNENRATNCVTRNIYKSVNASQRHITAINDLIKSHRLDRLTDELRETALLRLENSDASLSELALMHTPPISKSGLTHRLEKICTEAQLIQNEKKI